VRAERRAGELIPKTIFKGGDRKSKSYDDTLILADIGVTKNQSSQVFARSLLYIFLLGWFVECSGSVRLEISF